MLIMLMGLPASGKTTKAKELQRHIEQKLGEQAVILSTDLIRQELCGDMTDQSKNIEVFNLVYKRMEQLLSQQQHIIFDATNLTVKNRARALNLGKKHKTRVSLYFMNTSFEKCLLRNEERDRKVPRYVIKRMAKNLQFPTKEEGFDYIEVIGC